MAPGVGGGSGQPAPSPAHTGDRSGATSDRGHRGVQRSISATSSNKPRRGSTGGAQPSEANTSNNNNNTTSDSVQTGSAGPGAQGAPEPGQGLQSMIGPFHVCVFGFLSYTKVV